MITEVNSNNEIYETLGSGETNILKDIGLRNIKMDIYLPNNLNLPFVQKKYAVNCILDKPIIYLNKFRQFKIDKKPFRFMITRILPSNEEIFETNIKVSLEEYSVYEKAGEEGDFYVSLYLKEYRDITVKEFSKIDDTSFSESVKREHKEVPKTYTVKSGDTLWDIAKREFNDETLYKTLMQINGIEDPYKLQIGTVLRLE